MLNKEFINNSWFIDCPFITARKRSLGQGNMFTGVCLSTGGVPDQVHPGTRYTPRSRHPQEQTPPLEQTPPSSKHLPGSKHPPRADTPQQQTPSLGADTPQADTHQEQTSPWEQTPPGADTTHGSRHPQSRHPPPAKSMLGDTVNARAVRILLECNLV